MRQGLHLERIDYDHASRLSVCLEIHGEQWRTFVDVQDDDDADRVSEKLHLLSLRVLMADKSVAEMNAVKVGDTIKLNRLIAPQ